MKRNQTLILLFLILCSERVFCQQTYHHGVFWGRVVLADNITSRSKWELYLQKRTQNLEPGESNIFKSHHFTSVWLWTSYDLNKKMKLSVSPFGYFNSKVFNLTEADASIPGVNEYRWSARAETKEEFKFLNYINRYSLEYRWRDMKNNNSYLSNWRIRFMLRLEKPVRKVLSAERPITFFIADEIFFQFGEAVKNNPNSFDQNRFNIGASYEVVKNIKLTLSYLNIVQTRVSGKAIDNANVLWVVLQFDNLFSQFSKKNRQIREEKQ